MPDHEKLPPAPGASRTLNEDSRRPKPRARRPSKYSRELVLGVAARLHDDRSLLGLAHVHQRDPDGVRGESIDQSRRRPGGMHRPAAPIGSKYRRRQWSTRPECPGRRSAEHQPDEMGHDRRVVPHRIVGEAGVRSRLVARASPRTLRRSVSKVTSQDRSPDSPGLFPSRKRVPAAGRKAFSDPSSFIVR